MQNKNNKSSKNKSLQPTKNIAKKSANLNATKHATIDNEDELSYQLITEQTSLRETRDGKNSRGLLILINGMENSGKGEAVKALTEWMDARYIKVHATMGQHPSRYQPIWQRHTQQLPRHGEIAVYFGNWYADLIRYVFDAGDNIDGHRLQQMIEDIEVFEHDLTNNNTDIVKCWFSVDSKILKKRLSDNEPDPEQLYHLDWSRKKDIKRFKRLSTKLLAVQSSWHQIDGEDIDAANLQFGNIVLNAIRTLNQQSVNDDRQDQSVKNTKSATQNSINLPNNANLCQRH